MEHTGVILKCLECVCVCMYVRVCPCVCVCAEVGGETRKLSLNAFLSAHLSSDPRSEPSSLENEDCFDIFSDENLK